MEIFAAVVGVRGFRAAAERLGISSPAESKAVRRLEARLGEFTEDGHDFSVAVPARVVTNDVPSMLRLACAGVGLLMVMEEVGRPYIERRARRGARVIQHAVSGVPPLLPPAAPRTAAAARSSTPCAAQDGRRVAEAPTQPGDASSSVHMR